MRIDDDVEGPAAAWPLAVLLTDDRADAEALMTTALAGRHREPAALRRAVARAALDVADRPASASPPRDPAAAAVAATLRALPRRTRVLAVVHLLDPPSAGELRATAAECDAAVAALAAELGPQDARARAEREALEAPFRAPGSPPPVRGPDRTPLPDRLRALAAGTELTAAQTAALERDAAERRRSRRRTRLRVLAAVLALAGLAALVRVVPWPGAAAPPVDVFAGPTRGSLAGDAEFLTELQAQRWAGTDLATQPPPAERRVVWAADVDGGRAALVVSGTGRDFAAAWFAGPPGAMPRGMRVQGVQLAPDRSLPVALAAPVSGALVVVGAEGDRVEVSPRPEVAADGTVSRTFSPATTVDGVTTVELPQSTRTDTPAVRFTVVRDGSELAAGPLDLVTEPDPGPPWLPRLRPAPPPAAGDAAVDDQLEDLLGRLGQRGDTSGTTVLWAGDLPGRDDRPVRTTLVAVPQPSGAVVVIAPHGTTADLSGRADSASCVTGTLPAGPPLGQRVVAVRCDLGGSGPVLLVVGPRGAGTVRLFDETGAALDDRPMDDGVAVLTSPALVAAVQVTTADGRTVGAPVVEETDLRG
ncbi:hypothetical protein O2W14_04390 [Modestobacter sp. VKM Ac-2986]|uniref:hypothetical protein n=1 Tax=Modestobacter sp. VKM Ac-2986 TaxID=3004140 RepID=UPI0022AA25C7|nr:hypothetical protein [Modestobacter sp. VKM Ac-2986]MCZ2828072.1 hypothetical protein [Modestobacter sp. VKM Ac-2986]